MMRIKERSVMIGSIIALVGTALAWMLAPYWLLADPSDSWAVWSPDGNQIAYTCNRRERWNGELLGKWEELCVSSPQGESMRQITHNQVWDDQPRWHPDNGQLAFQTLVDSGSHTIRIVDPGDSAAPSVSTVRQLVPMQASFRHYHWSPDGAKLAFSVYDSERREDHLYVMRYPDKAVEYVGQIDLLSDFAWSSDSQALVLVVGDEESSDLYVARPESGSISRLTNEDGLATYYSPVWSPTGQHITFLASPGIEDPFDAYVINVASSETKRLWADRARAVAWSADGRYLSLVTSTEVRDQAGYLMPANRVSILDITTGTLVSYVFDSPTVGYIWSPVDFAMIINRLDDWDRDGRPHGKLWHLDLDTGLMQPVTVVPWWLHGDREHTLEAERSETTFELP